MRRITVILFLSTCLAAGGMPAVAQEANPEAVASEMPLHADPAPWPSTELERLQTWDRPIAAGHGRFVVVGDRTGRDKQAPRATAWTSTDGLTWSEAPAAPALLGATMLAVTAFDGGFAAIGSEAGKTPDETFGKNVVAWISSDGRTWQRASIEGPGSRYPRAFPQDVVAGPAGLLAYGDFGGQDVMNQRLWRSDDGLTWEIASFPETEGILFSSLTGFPGGYLLTGVDTCWVGECSMEPPAPGQSRPLWRSTDGVTWEAIAGPPDGVLDELAASDDGTVVAIGGSQDEVRIWVTSDLESWQPVWTRPKGSASGRAADRNKDGTQLTGVDWDGGRFVATGQFESGEVSSGLILVSADGITWVESNGPDGVPGPDSGTYLAGTATLDGITVGLGSDAGSSVAWLADLVPTDAADGQPVG